MPGKKLSIGLVGLGTVGSSVVEILQKRRAEFLKGGFDFRFKALCDRNTRKRRGALFEKEIITSSYRKILDDPDIDVVIELIGGANPAEEIIFGALERGKSVITANKGIVAGSGPSIAARAREKGCYFGFRATLTGCYAVIDQLVHGGPIRSVSGVFNGTSNYILTSMKDKNIELEQAVGEARKLGYAERDPSDDIDGIDTEYKIRIVSMLVFGFSPPGGKMLVEGIRGITVEDLKFAAELGCEIRLLGISAKLGNEMDVRVHPALVPQDSSFALLRGAQNSIEIDDVLRGRGGAVYEGAGGFPAASAVIQDLIDASENAPINWPAYNLYGDNLSYLPKSKISSRYYVLFRARNRPGVLAGISSALAENGINIERVEQKEEEKDGLVPLVLITDEAFEEDVVKAVDKISAANIVSGAPKLIRFWSRAGDRA